MQEKKGNIEQNLINELNALVLSIKSAKPGITEEKIASALGYSEGYIPQARSRGNVSKRFVDALRNYRGGLQNTMLPKPPEPQEKEPLETAIENLSESKLIDSKNIARLINLLELKLGVKPDMSMFPEPGTPASETLTKKVNSGKP